MNTRSARTYLAFHIQVISLIPSLIKIKKIKKKKHAHAHAHEGFVFRNKNTSQRASQRERKNISFLFQDFFFFFPFVFINFSPFCSPFSICKINDNLRSVVSVPEFSPGFGIEAKEKNKID